MSGSKLRDKHYQNWADTQIHAMISLTDDENQPMLASYLLMAAMRCFEAAYGDEKLVSILNHAVTIRKSTRKNGVSPRIKAKWMPDTH
jgi:hypothetical protein